MSRVDDSTESERDASNGKGANMSIYLSIVIPLLNEEETVEKLVSRIVDVGNTFSFDYEIVLVDDGSTDNTWKEIERLKESVTNIKGIKLGRNYGQTNAMVAGFDHSLGEIIVTLDGDLQNDPADIPKLLKKMNQGFDIVSGWRKDRKDHFSRVLPSRVANYIISATTGISLHDYGCSLKAYRAVCIKPIKAYGEMHRFFPALASMTGARVAEMPVEHSPRRYGQSKYGFDRIFKVFSDIFSMNLIIRFSSTPLMGFAIATLPFAILAAFFGGMAVFAGVTDWTAGKSDFFAVLAALNLMAVIVLLSLGILGEMVVANSDLTHADLAEINKRFISIDDKERLNGKHN